MTGGGWLTTHEDITDRLAAREQITTQNNRFEAAISAMSNAFCMFDKHRNIVVANDKYAQIYKLDPAVIRPGMNLKEVAELRIKNGCYQGKTPEEYLKIIKGVGSKKHGEPYTYELNDGRHVRVVEYEIAGGDMLSLHEDVTTSTKSQSVLREQNQVLGEAISIMPQGMALYDADKNLVLCNDRYSTFYGLQPGEIKPGMNAMEIVEMRIASGNFPQGSPDEYREHVTNILKNMTSGSRIYKYADGKMVSIRRLVMESGGWLAIHDEITENNVGEREPNDDSSGHHRAA